MTIHLNGSPRMTARSVAGQRTCAECGETVTGVRDGAEFCCQKHQQDWNNRLSARGKLLALLYIPHRFERAEAQRLGAMTLINRLVARWHREDQRVGRRSAHPLRVTLDRNPHLRASLAVDITPKRKRS